MAVVESLASCVLRQLLHGGVSGTELEGSGARLPHRVLCGHADSFLTELAVINLECGIGGKTFGCDGIQRHVRGGEKVGRFADFVLEVPGTAEWVGEIGVGHNSGGERTGEPDDVLASGNTGKVAGEL